MRRICECQSSLIGQGAARNARLNLTSTVSSVHLLSRPPAPGTGTCQEPFCTAGHQMDRGARITQTVSALNRDYAKAGAKAQLTVEPFKTSPPHGTPTNGLSTDFVQIECRRKSP